MQITDISWETIVTCIATILCCFAAYNSWYTTRKNFKANKAERNEPIQKINERLATDKARLDNHEAMIHSLQNDSADTREGLNVIGIGVQALIDKDQVKMKAASDDITKWVWKSHK